MGRLSETFLPLVSAHIRLDLLTNDSKFSEVEVRAKLKEDYGAMDKKLAAAMFSFLRESRHAYEKGDKLEEVDKSRFEPGYKEVKDMMEKMETLGVSEF
mmetsp:Transcript_24872/g.38682  ORF Transcript_24872/g.38682 Transcript_24872/m.38682 type:complete len:99 (-) Transcript_24872:12-308(-)